MSNPISKQERSKAKDARQMPAPDIKPKRKPGKKDKPFIVMYKWVKPILFSDWGKTWTKLGEYRTREIAEKVISDDRRKYPDRYIYKTVKK